ncbi:glyoxalase superfamily protein [Aquibium sp. ELW1220]|jgi:catechol 2,3-dioxygenase-like lactoylglutathione lyase family enzyme|uniref:glyoxalase superfamily protein n=1 Tax=Aquibium sp. ELW1220 TaxID=2976766 RepID=UPI0025B26CCA|nr:glyoxalase superfamily protein [Aquibium sp. ELW1220]MDN2579149.1 VOC family protein [Aquibium sp. ELW1220]
MRTYLDAKAMAKSLREAMRETGVDLTHSAALELVARQFGLPNWNVLSAKIGAAGTTDGEGAGDAPFAFEPPVPIMRIFDEAKAREFYCGFLGFSVDWEHRFGDDFPLYCQVSRANLRLHLSEHAGDATPGGNMVVFMTGIAAFHAELKAKDYRYMKPGIVDQDWGAEMQVTDPFSNRMRFIERKPD